MKQQPRFEIYERLPTRRQAAATLLGIPFGSGVARSTSGQTHVTTAGVIIGAQSYSFRDRELDACIQGYVECGLRYAELWHGHLEPKSGDLRHWRITASESFFKNVRAKFDRAAVCLLACSFDLDNSFSDEEMDHIFKMISWMGLKQMTVSPKLDVVQRLDGFATKYKIYVCIHNHATMKPNDLSTSSDFATALQNCSQYIRVNLDIGNATAAGWDPVEYFVAHQNQISILHLKDCKLPTEGHVGATVPWGRGDTDIRKILRLLQKSGSHIPANIEYQYGTLGMNSVAEVQRCFQYCREALA